MNNKLMPALIGGAIVGILSALFTVIPLPFVGLCCCLWSIGGGALAVMMYIKKSPTPVRIGEGAMLGAMAGLIGGVIYFVLMLLFGLIIGTSTYEARMSQYKDSIPPWMTGFAIIIMIALMGAIFLIILSTIGGLIGVPIFEKRKGGDAPPPSPPFGDQPPGGGGYGGGVGAGQPGGSGYGTGA